MYSDWIINKLLFFYIHWKSSKKKTVYSQTYLFTFWGKINYTILSVLRRKKADVLNSQVDALISTNVYLFCLKINQ